MRPKVILIGLLVMALSGGVLAPARAQETFTPQQQAALDDIRAAYEQLIALDSYSATLTMQLNQDLTMKYLGKALSITQKVEAKGTLLLEAAPGFQQPNQDFTLVETMSADQQGTGQEPYRGSSSFNLETIIASDRVYLRMEFPASMAGVFPQGWHDVTGGAKGYPGLEMIDFEGLLKLGTPLSPEFMDTLFAAVREVDILAQEVVEGRTLDRYRLTLDPLIVYQHGGLAALGGVFNENAIHPIDATRLIELLYSDPNTRFIVEYAIDAGDHTLHEYTGTVSTDVDVSEALSSDVAPFGATVTLAQTVITTVQPYAFNEPVDIQVPELAP
jgi:hypothetical protein